MSLDEQGNLANHNIPTSVPMNVPTRVPMNVPTSAPMNVPTPIPIKKEPQPPPNIHIESVHSFVPENQVSKSFVDLILPPEMDGVNCQKVLSPRVRLERLNTASVGRKR